MKRIHGWFWSLVRMCVVVGVVWGLAGCQGGMMKGSNGSVPKDKLIALDGARDARWDARDLSVFYNLERRGNQVRMSGTVHYADLLRYNFTLIRYFHMSIFLTDADGRIFREEPLTSSVPDDIDHDLDFSRSFTLPDGAAYFAFSYSGKALDANDDGGSNPTDFWEYPVR